jgi:type IV pilus assembly protein PilX
MSPFAAFAAPTRAPRRQRGAALVVGLILLLVLTVLAISGMTTAALQLQMAGNEQFQERAFQFAEGGLEQAMDAGIFNTNTAVGTYDNIAAIDPIPTRGTGQQIANCPEVDDATTAEQCEYFLRFDLQAGQTAVPGGGFSLNSGFEAYHFIIDSYGAAERGAMSEHRQSFYVVGPSGT